MYHLRLTAWKEENERTKEGRRKNPAGAEQKRTAEGRKYGERAGKKEKKT